MEKGYCARCGVKLDYVMDVEDYEDVYTLVCDACSEEIGFCEDDCEDDYDESMDGDHASALA